MNFNLSLRDDASGSEYEQIEADDLDEAIDETKERAVEWVYEGDWGINGVIINVYFTLTNEEDEEVYRDSLTVEIDPDEDALMKHAGAPKDCNHEFTSEGEGGCDQNPGVWSIGGTALVFKSHCKHCGLKRTERHCGSQRNPGEHDTVEFEMPLD